MKIIIRSAKIIDSKKKPVDVFKEIQNEMQAIAPLVASVRVPRAASATNAESTTPISARASTSVSCYDPFLILSQRRLQGFLLEGDSSGG